MLGDDPFSAVSKIEECLYLREMRNEAGLKQDKPFVNP